MTCHFTNAKKKKNMLYLSCAFMNPDTRDRLIYDIARLEAAEGSAKCQMLGPSTTLREVIQRNNYSQLSAPNVDIIL